MRKYLFIFSFFIIFFIGCGEDANDISFFHPPTKIYNKDSFYYQLNGDLKDVNARVYIVDLFNVTVDKIKELKSKKKVVICNFSAGIYEEDSNDSNKFPEDVKGKIVENTIFDRWLNINDDRVLDIMRERIRMAKDKRCDGVNFANVDVYKHDSGFNISYDDQIAYNKKLSSIARNNYTLLVGFSNNIDQVKDLQLYFNFVVNEECHINNNCDKLDIFASNKKAVFNVEYDSKYLDEDEFKSLCRDSNKRGFSTIFLSRNLDGSIIKSCDY